MTRRAPLFRNRSAAAAGTATLLALVAMEVADVRTRPAPGDDVRDDGTASLFAAAMGVALTAVGMSLLRRDRRSLPRSRWGFWAGLATTWCGIGMNRWARRTLATNYRPVVTVLDGHELVDHGPYRIVRHPMYLGSVLICCGVGAAVGTRHAQVAWALPPLALMRRIVVEEAALAEHFGARHGTFSEQRARLIPFVW